MRPYERGDIVEIKNSIGRLYGVVVKILDEGMLRLHLSDSQPEVEVHESKVRFPNSKLKSSVRDKYKALLEELLS